MEFHCVTLRVGSGIENLVEKKKISARFPSFFDLCETDYAKRVTRVFFFFSLVEDAVSRFSKGNRRALQCLTRVNFLLSREKILVNV